jgi:hypothetical protein
MTNDGVNLLRRLGSGVIPDGASPAVAGRPIERTDFPTLLVGAARGRVRTGRAVLVRAELKQPLTMAQLTNLADAADLAQAAGAFSVVTMIDDRALTLDVSARRITGEIPLECPALTPSDVIAGIDAIVVAQATIGTRRQESEHLRGTTTTPGAARRLAAELMKIQNRSVAQLLAGDPVNHRAG